MSVTSPMEGRAFDRSDDHRTIAHDAPTRLSTETKAAFKTTEFVA